MHVSELSNRFIKDPNEAVKVGQIVKVQVLSADPKTKRISLSIKALQASQLPPVKHGVKQKAQAPVKTVNEKLADLSSRFRSR